MSERTERPVLGQSQKWKSSQELDDDRFRTLQKRVLRDTQIRGIHDLEALRTFKNYVLMNSQKMIEDQKYY